MSKAKILLGVLVLTAFVAGCESDPPPKADTGTAPAPSYVMVPSEKGGGTTTGN